MSFFPKRSSIARTLGDGQPLFLIEAAEGDYRLTPYDPTFESKMKKDADIMSRYRNTLHALAK